MKAAFQEIKERQLALFQSGKTRTLKWRRQQLNKLTLLIKENEEALCQALNADLNRSSFETYVAELGPSLQEIEHLKRRMAYWSSPRKQVTNQLIHFWSKAEVLPQPKGNVLIIAPWNYPFFLLFPPLAGALAAGCTAVLKPSELLANTSPLLSTLIKQYFPEDEVALIEGNAEVSQALTEMPWDHIFFTGSTPVGKKIMEAAAKNLSPLTLELGGKCPCIIDESADLKIAARRIAWGKLLNSGQTCVAPDHVWVKESVYPSFVSLLKSELKSQYEKLGSDYSHLINEKNFERMLELADHHSAWKAGELKKDKKHFPPIVLELQNQEHRSMKEEIFGPVLPILSFTDDLPQEVISTHQKSPLAIYFFGKKNKRWKKLKDFSRSGALIRNEVVMHLAHASLPFGGVGESGFGHYHGIYSFECFTHSKSILEKWNRPDLFVRYAPYKGKLSFMQRLFSLK